MEASLNMVKRWLSDTEVTGQETVYASHAYPLTDLHMYGMFYISTRL